MFSFWILVHSKLTTSGSYLRASRCRNVLLQNNLFKSQSIILDEQLIFCFVYHNYL